MDPIHTHSAGRPDREFAPLDKRTGFGRTRAMRIVIMGNSGSGKSTLAKQLAETHGLAHLDLDTLAWLPTTPPQRAPDALAKLDAFMTTEQWVIEGCYA